MTTARVSPSTALLLTISPLLWAGNAVVGRMVNQLIPPITLNFLRWAIAFVLLLPLAARVLHPKSALWKRWQRFAMLGLLGIGLFNALQYLALQSSTPINVTLVSASMPIWMLAVGALFFRSKINQIQVIGAILSIAGVLIVLGRGDWHQLAALRLVPGDLYMILAAIVWSVYSWLLIQPGDPPELHDHWASFLLAQMAFGIVWSGLFALGEWTIGSHTIQWGWPLALALAYVAIGPAIIAFRFWGVGVQRAGPEIGSFFSNLTPLFAALMSSAFLGEMPHLYHVFAFGLIVGGIVLSSRN